MIDNSLNKRRELLVVLLLVLVTAAVYWQIRNHEFVDYDDAQYITKNVHVQGGLTIDGIIWAFNAGYAGNWHPLTWMSHMIDCQLYGLNPAGHHVTNLLLHIANIILLFVLFRRMTGALWQSAFIAALFALHPLHVESVAWTAERKDVLSTFFWMLTMIAYLRYVEQPAMKRFLPVILSFGLGLLAKPMLVTLPFVLLLMDYWPLHRIQFTESRDKIKSKSLKHWDLKANKPVILQLVREKIPLFVLAVLSSVVTFIGQQRGGAVESLAASPIHIRIANALVSYLQYIGKTFWPSDLSVIYVHPGDSIPKWQIMLACALLVGVSYGVARFWKRIPYLVVGWLWYLGTLVPVIGIVQVGLQSMADRYMYVPMIGLSIMIAWGVSDLVSGWSPRRIALSIAAGAVLLGLSVRTWIQLTHWHDRVSLFENAINVTDNNWVAHLNLGLAFIDQGKNEEAIDQYTEVLRLKPYDIEGNFNMGFAQARQGNIPEAVKYYSEAIRLKPNYVDAHNNLGVILAGQGKIAEAIAHYSEALRTRPDYSDAHNNIGSLLASEGKFDEAIEHFSEAIRIKPDYMDARNNLKNALEHQGKSAEAVARLTNAMQSKKDEAGAHLNLGNLLAEQGKSNEAMTHYAEALRIDPKSADAHLNMGNLLAQQGKNNEAMDHYAQALRIKPDFADAHNNMANLLAMQGKTAEALTHYSEAIRINPDLWNAHYNLGLILVGQGKIAESIEQYSEALRIKPDYTDARINLERARELQRQREK